jgi:hypothetical protein
MKTTITFILAMLLGASLTAQKPVISVLGTLHLHNPGNDAINADPGDITSPKRQAELKESIELVSRFKPTKIAVEWAKGDTLWSRHYYHAWLAGELENIIDPEDEFYLTSETVQLVYPLAKAAGLTELHPIDAYTSFPMDSAMTWATENGQDEEMADLNKALANGQHIADSLVKLSITDILRACNSNYFAQSLNQNLYLKHLIGLGTGDDYPGSFLVEEWYARNIRIFTNLHRITEKGDRTLVIFGAGHKEVLDDLIKDRSDWKWHSASKLLDNVEE